MLKLLIDIPEFPKHQPPDFILYDRVSESKLNARQRREIYNWLTNEYSEYCVYCGKSPAELDIKPGKLDIDHIDGNSRHHYWRNLVQACHRCNCRKNAKNWKKNMSTVSLSLSISDKEMPRAMTAQTFLKSKYLPRFLAYLEEAFQNTDRVELKTIFTTGRMRSGFPSLKTIKEDYWPVITCPEGPLYEWTDSSTDVEYARLRSLVTIKEFKDKFCK